MVILMVFILSIVQAHATEGKKSSVETQNVLSADSGQKNPMFSIYKCGEAIEDSAHMKRESKFFGSHRWFSPSKKPDKYQTAYRIHSDRIEAYDLTQVTSIIARERKYSFRDSEGDFTLYVPSMTDEFRFDSPRVGGGLPQNFPRLQPKAVYRKPSEAEHATEIVREGIFPSMIDQFLKNWKGMQKGDDPNWSRKSLEERLKRVVCDCVKAQVIDPLTHSAILAAIDKPASRYQYSTEDTKELSSIAEAIGCELLISQARNE